MIIYTKCWSMFCQRNDCWYWLGGWGVSQLSEKGYVLKSGKLAPSEETGTRLHYLLRQTGNRWGPHTALHTPTLQCTACIYPTALHCLYLPNCTVLPVSTLLHYMHLSTALHWLYIPYCTSLHTTILHCTGRIYHNAPTALCVAAMCTFK